MYLVDTEFNPLNRTKLFKSILLSVLIFNVLITELRCQQDGKGRDDSLYLFIQYKIRPNRVQDVMVSIQ